MRTHSGYLSWIVAIWILIDPTRVLARDWDEGYLFSLEVTYGDSESYRFLMVQPLTAGKPVEMENVEITVHEPSSDFASLEYRLVLGGDVIGKAYDRDGRRPLGPRKVSLRIQLDPLFSVELIEREGDLPLVQFERSAWLGPTTPREFVGDWQERLRVVRAPGNPNLYFALEDPHVTDRLPVSILGVADWDQREFALRLHPDEAMATILDGNGVELGTSHLARDGGASDSPWVGEIDWKDSFPLFPTQLLPRGPIALTADLRGLRDHHFARLELEHMIQMWIPEGGDPYLVHPEQGRIRSALHLRREGVFMSPEKKVATPYPLEPSIDAGVTIRRFGLNWREELALEVSSGSLFVEPAGRFIEEVDESAVQGMISEVVSGERALYALKFPGRSLDGCYITSTAGLFTRLSLFVRSNRGGRIAFDTETGIIDFVFGDGEYERIAIGRADNYQADGKKGGLIAWDPRVRLASGKLESRPALELDLTDLERTTTWVDRVARSLDEDLQRAGSSGSGSVEDHERWARRLLAAVPTDAFEAADGESPDEVFARIIDRVDAALQSRAETWGVVRGDGAPGQGVYIGQETAGQQIENFVSFRKAFFDEALLRIRNSNDLEEKKRLGRSALVMLAQLVVFAGEMTPEIRERLEKRSSLIRMAFLFSVLGIGGAGMGYISGSAPLMSLSAGILSLSLAAGAISIFPRLSRIRTQEFEDRLVELKIDPPEMMTRLSRALRSKPAPLELGSVARSLVCQGVLAAGAGAETP